MANAEPADPRDLESWEDAFKYPIPAVRGMEKKLRTGANENKEKLKTLVGVSYRELLGTAHTIIQANSQIQQVESLLVDVGRRCDSRIVHKIASNHVQLRADDGAHDNHQNRRASQLFLLQQSLKIVARILKTHGSSLVAAKLLVISRLLHKTLPQSAGITDIDTLFGRRRNSLHAKLLRYIDRRLERPFAEHVDLVQDLTAFALATSSAPSDVLRHFQHLRVEAIKKPLSHISKKDLQTRVIRRFKLFFATAREIHAVYPDLLQASLRTLSARSLLDDPDIRTLDELRLDSHSHWISPDIKHFTPWTRHEEPNQQNAAQAFSAWSLAGFKAFTPWLQEQLHAEIELQRLFDLRTEVVQLWLSNKHFTVRDSRSETPGLSSRQVVHDLGLIFTARFKELIDPHFTALLDAIKTPISDSLKAPDGTSSNSTWVLWDKPTVAMSITNGAAPLRETIVHRKSGQDENIRQMLRAFRVGFESINQLQQVLKQMRETRWEDEDNDSGDGPDDSPYPTWLLSNNEPKEIHAHLKWQASLCVGDLERYLTEELSPATIECSAPNSPGIFLLRAIRELRRNIPLLLKDLDPKLSQRLYFSDLITQFYTRLSESLSRQTTPIYENTLHSYVHSTHNPRGLWEGTSPPLPIQITPATFRTLRAVAKEMEAFGPDIWAPDAAAAVRDALDIAFAQTLQTTAEQLEQIGTVPEKATQAFESTSNGTQTDESTETSKHDPDTASHDTVSEDEHENGEQEGKTEEEAPAKLAVTVVDKDHANDKLTQLLFDAAYLANALSSGQADNAEFRAAQETKARNSQLVEQVVPLLVSKTGVDEAVLARINKSAADYWRKTYLLFGLLCG